MCVLGFSAQITTSPLCGVAKDSTPTRLRKQMGEPQLSNTTMLREQQAGTYIVMSQTTRLHSEYVPC